MLIVCDGNMQLVDERLNQIQQYRQLHSYSHGAKTMMKIKEMFKLSGDFTAVEILVDLVSIFFRLFGTNRPLWVSGPMCVVIVE